MSLLIQGTANVNTEAMQVGTTQPCLVVRSNDASIKDVFLVLCEVSVEHAIHLFMFLTLIIHQGVLISTWH